MNDVSLNQKKFIDVIEQIISLNKTSHSYLIEMDNNPDNYIYLYDFIKLILCKEKKDSIDKLNCSKCNICKLIDDGNYPDLEIIEPDGNWIKKGQLLALQSEYQNKSLLDNKRIYIIREADKLNQAAANTILKFLEEPEDDIIAFLITSNRYKVLETILSRCQILSLKGCDSNIDVDDNLLEFMKCIESKKDLFIKYNYLLTDILIDKKETKTLLNKLENIYIDYLSYVSKDNIVSYNSDVVSILNGTKIDTIVKYISIIEAEVSKLEYNVNYKLWLDSFFSRIMEV